MELTAVIFDLFGTLVNDFGSPGGTVHMEKMAAALGAPSEQFKSLWAQTTQMRIIGAFDTVEANLDYVCRSMSITPAFEQIRHAVEIRMQHVRQALQPRPDAVETLSHLKEAGYRTGLVSNCSIEIPILWLETAFASLIETAVFSSRERLKKPDTRMYDLACERLGVAPGSCLYIADGEDHELSAAARVGLHPVLLRTSPPKSSRRSHQEAEEWQGPRIDNLMEIVERMRK